jgi:hypothetical protein
LSTRQELDGKQNLLERVPKAGLWSGLGDPSGETMESGDVPGGETQGGVEQVLRG